jgi:hypothetical protein
MPSAFCHFWREKDEGSVELGPACRWLSNGKGEEEEERLPGWLKEIYRILEAAPLIVRKYVFLWNNTFLYYYKSNSSGGLQIEASKTYLEAQLENIEVQTKHTTPVGISTQASILPWALYVRERGCSRKNNT